MHHSSMSWEVSLLYFFSWNFIWFLKKELTKVQNFRLSTAQLTFYQICTLISYFCWKYVKFQLKKYGGVISHDTKEWRKIWRKNNSWFGKWHEELGKRSSEHLKVSKLVISWDPFVLGRKFMSYKFTKEL